MSTGLEKLISYGLRTLTWKLEKEICPNNNLDLVIHGLLTVCSVSKAIDSKKMQSLICYSRLKNSPVTMMANAYQWKRGKISVIGAAEIFGSGSVSALSQSSI